MFSDDELQRIVDEVDTAKQPAKDAQQPAAIDASRGSPECQPAAPLAHDRPHWQFKPGQSGNPHGRPKGSKNRRRGLAEALLESDAPELARLALDEALAGDKVMLRACLTRAVAPARGRPVRLKLPNGYKPITMLQALVETQDRMTAGLLTPQEGREIAAFLTQRIAAHEAWLRSVRLEKQLGVTWSDEDEEDGEDDGANDDASEERRD